jgi:hypothetical protein
MINSIKVGFLSGSLLRSKSSTSSNRITAPRTCVRRVKIAAASESSRSSPKRVKSAGVIRIRRVGLDKLADGPRHISLAAAWAIAVLDDPGGPCSMKAYLASGSPIWTLRAIFERCVCKRSRCLAPILCVWHGIPPYPSRMQFSLALREGLSFVPWPRSMSTLK